MQISVGTQETQGTGARTGRSRVGLHILWGLAILLFGVGDLLTTSFALGLGAVEGNSVTKLLMDILGGGVWTLTIVKSALLSSLLLLSYLKMGKYAWTIPAVLTCASTFMLMHNIAVLLALHT